MPKYEKKNSKPKKRAGKTVIRDNSENDIFMTDETPERPKRNKRSFNVVNGGKAARKKRFASFVAVLLVIAAIFSVFCFSVPVFAGDIFANRFLTLGIGGFPTESVGSEAKNTCKIASSVMLLTDTSVECCNKSGKKVFSDLHGYSEPVMFTSRGRAVVVDEGGYDVSVYNCSGKKLSFKTENKIYCAGIADNGTFAVATEGTDYTSVLTVYDRKGSVMYTWYCSEDIINCVTLSSKGKKAAVSLLHAENGRLISKISVLGFSSAEPEFTKEFADGIVYQLYSDTLFGFKAISESGYMYVKWNKYTVTENTFEYAPYMSRKCDGKTVVCCNIGGDKTNNRFLFYSKNGKLSNTVDFPHSVNDFAAYGSKLFVIGETTAYIVNSEGNVTTETPVEFGIRRIVPINAHTVIAVTDNKVEKISF